MPIILDIYIETGEDGLDDHYIERHWNVLPETGDVIVHTAEENDNAVFEGVVRRRLFCTDDQGNLRVQLHCEASLHLDKTPRETESVEPL